MEDCESKKAQFIPTHIDKLKSFYILYLSLTRKNGKKIPDLT